VAVPKGSECLRKFSLVLVLKGGSEDVRKDLPFLGARNCQNS